MHDARYGDTIPLGHEDTWFTDAGEPALGVTQVVNEDEDDIVIDREKVSTKCPITFQTLKEPYTSTKCGGRGGGQHTFEKSAILDMIRTSGRHYESGGKKSVACPISGCDNVSVQPAGRLFSSSHSMNSALILMRNSNYLQTTSALTPSSYARSSAYSRPLRRRV